MSTHLLFLVCLLTCGLAARDALAGTAPPRHPYLYFGAEDLPALRERVRHPQIAPLWERVRARALKPERTRRQANNVLCAGIAYNLTGDPAYARPAIDILMRLANEQGTWRASGSGLKYCDLDTAIKALPLAYGYDMLYHAMTPPQRDACLQALRSKVFRFYLQALAVHDAERGRFSDGKGHTEWWSNCYFNWNPWVNGSIGLAGLASLYELPESVQVVQRARESLRYMHPEFDQGEAEDGGWDEGPMYWGTTVSQATQFYAALERVLGTDDGFFELPGMRLTMRYGMDFTAPDGRWVNFQDCGDRLVLDPPSVLYFLAMRYDSPQYVRHLDVNSARWHTRPFAILWRPPIETPPAEPRPAARLYRDVHWAVMLQDEMFVPFKAGDLGANHGQNDANNMLLWVGGERMLNDPGYGHRDASDHNCLLVNGQGQTRQGSRRLGGRTAAFAEILECRAAGGESYLVSEAAPCYGGALERYQRHVVVCQGAYVLVLDDVLAAEPSQFTVNWHTKLDAQLNGPGGGIISGERERLHLAWNADSPSRADLGQTRFDRAFALQSPDAVRSWRLVTVLARGQAPALDTQFSDGGVTVTVNGRTHAFRRSSDGGVRYTGAGASGR